MTDTSTHSSAVNGIAPLQQDLLLSLSGPDAAKFLQGQTSADFASATPGDVRLGAFCDVKGRVLTDFLAIVASTETILLRVRADLAERLQQHLSKYLMFSKASLNVADYQVFGLIGQAAHEHLGLENGQDNTSAVMNDGWALPRGDWQTELWLAYPPSDTLVAQPEDSWLAQSIQRGEARVCAQTWGKYLPQDLNYDLNGWVNFKKGCYTGQEVIARLHWRGKPKRRLALASAPAAALPEPGTALITDEGRTLGSVVNAASWQNKLWLAVETTEDGLDQGLHWSDGPVLAAAG